MSVDYITSEIKALIGAESGLIEAGHPVETSEVRRFHHAVMDDAPRYWGEQAERYGGAVAPPGFPVHAFRRAAKSTDPLNQAGEPDFDGVSRSLREGLPAVNVPLPRLLNGGYEYELFCYAKPNDRIFVKSRYEDIYQRDGKTGPMVFIVIEDTYLNQRQEPLVKTKNTIILR